MLLLHRFCKSVIKTFRISITCRISKTFKTFKTFKRYEKDFVDRCRCILRNELLLQESRQGRVR